MRPLTAMAFGVLLVASPRLARAEGDQPEGGRSPAVVPAAASSGAFLPTTMGARTDARGWVSTLGGYDAARKSALVLGTAGVNVFGPIDLQAGALFTEGTGTLRPSFGARVRLLGERRHGIDGAAAVFYRPQGLTEGEGELELVLAAARHFGRLGTFANVVYGQDPEAAERDGEVRLAALYAIREDLHAGADLRVRFDLGSEGGRRAAKQEAGADLLALGTASYSLGPVALSASAGLSAVKLATIHTGAAALAGLGTAF